MRILAHVPDSSREQPALYTSFAKVEYNLCGQVRAQERHDLGAWEAAEGAACGGDFAKAEAGPWGGVQRTEQERDGLVRVIAVQDRRRVVAAHTDRKRALRAPQSSARKRASVRPIVPCVAATEHNHEPCRGTLPTPRGALRPPRPAPGRSAPAVRPVHGLTRKT